MKRLISISIIFFLFSCAEKAEQPYGLAIHGGAGTITRENMSTEKEAEYISKLTAALKTGYAILENGGSGLDDEVLFRLTNKGFKKVNYATGIRDAYCNGIRNEINNTNSVIKPQKYLKSGRQEVTKFVKNIL